MRIRYWLSLLTACLCIGCSVQEAELSDTLPTDIGYAKKYLSAISYPLRTRKTSSRYGMRNGRMHTGIDFPAPKGTAVFASHDGVVIRSGKFLSGYGTSVKVKDGNFITLYAHLDHTLLAKGRKVKAGDPIGEVGSTGRATGNHLHFETRILLPDGNERVVNPRYFLR